MRQREERERSEKAIFSDLSLSSLSREREREEREEVIPFPTDGIVFANGAVRTHRGCFSASRSSFLWKLLANHMQSWT